MAEPNAIITQVPVFTQPAGIAINIKTNRIYIGGGGFPGTCSWFLTEGRTQSSPGFRKSFGVNNVAVNFRSETSPMALWIQPTCWLWWMATTRQRSGRIVPAAFPGSVDVNVLNNKVYVTNAQGRSVTIIDGKTNRVAANSAATGSVSRRRCSESGEWPYLR